MRNFNEDLKPIGYYIKDRERMLHEMFRCVRGHKLQAILPDGLKVKLRKYFFIYSNSSSNWKTKNERKIFFFFSNLNRVRLIIDPCFRLIYIYWNSYKITIDEIYLIFLERCLHIYILFYLFI
jgi:hypothetical protein